ncbi:MAG: iron-containing alcohol dehydrogenase, partial [Deltaproteobacteria bacterium]|nr:iron-containing alcohol dehydrogenase [Deltaproteobacteria bacterium]
RSLVQAYKNGNDIGARTDMCMAAVCGGTAFLKGLGIGHAITHVLGAHYHLPHGRAAIYGLLCFVKANKETCKEQFIDMAQMLNRCNDLEKGLIEFYKKLDIPIHLKNLGIPKDDLERIAFYTSRDAVNMATDPTSISQQKILELLLEIYE